MFHLTPRLTPIALVYALIVLAGCASIGKKGTDPFSITERADEAYQRGDWLVAEKRYKDLSRSVPKDPYAWMRLGNIRLKQNKFRGAILAYRAAIERDPEAPRGHYNLATAHLLLAREALEKAQQQLPKNDNGGRLITKKLEHFDALIYEPLLEVASPGQGLIQQEVTPPTAFENNRYPKARRLREF